MAATLPARMMALSGLMVLCFIIFHLLHYTAQTIDPSYRDLHDAQGRHDIYRMMILGFSNPLASGFYLVAVGLLAMHLQHGIQSLFQTLGLNSAKLRPLLEKGGTAFAWLLFIGYASIPIAVLTKIVH
jgi:succinate dehydrogenase / fumarate reductase cytochrome b subunit